jgi:hypothetical protein
MNSNESENTNQNSNSITSDENSTPEEINVFVTHLLEQMKNRFVTMGSTIINRMEDLDSRMKDLEKTVEGLMEASGTTRSETPSATAESQQPSAAS